MAPSRWPPEISFINTQQYHSSVTAAIRSQLRDSAQKLTSTQRRDGKRSPVAIMRIKNDNHPANGQYGLFATKKIPPRSHIINYVGEVHCDERSTSDYDLSLLRLQDGVSVGVDASAMGNETRFVNDYRGVAGRPNVFFREGLNEVGEMCISVWSGTDVIKKGDELLVSYGKGFWKARMIEIPSR